MTQPGLLVSVRSIAEAKAALAGGADLIDVKEPSRGPLGAPDFDVVEEIVAEVAGRTPVSVALGEWRDWRPRELPSGVSFAKWGLAQASVADASGILHLREQVCPVLVAYADYDRAKCPAPKELINAACELRFPAFLIDTAIKDGSGLLDWIGVSDLLRMRLELAGAGVRVALAGSLNADTIRQLGPIAPDWFAVRGAVCVGGREGTVCAEHVAYLKAIIGAELVQELAP